MYSNDYEGSSSSQRQKMAISRLSQALPPPRKPNQRGRDQRIARACRACRKRKVRCNGEAPRCANCQLTSSECLYEQARRDRLKESMHLNHSLTTLLHDLAENANSEDKRKIEVALHNVDRDLVLSRASPPLSSLGEGTWKHSLIESGGPIATHGETYVTASLRSNKDLDHLDEDLMRDRNARETGYVGQNSEVQWLRSVQRETEHTDLGSSNPRFEPTSSEQDVVQARSASLHLRQNNEMQAHRRGSTICVTDSTFYLDNTDIEVTTIVHPEDDPHPNVSQRLVEIYYETVHPFFPLVSEPFKHQLEKYLESVKHGSSYHVPHTWRAQMNLIFAIGAKYSHLVGAEWRGDENDHLIYMTRAVQLLGLKNTIMIIAAPDLPLVQATAGLAFYFMAIGQVSRAWIMIGVSIRLALTLGLHLRNEDPVASDSRKESLVHTWWCLHSIECLLSTITGRPPVIPIKDCTVPLPHSLPGALQSSKSALRYASWKQTEHESPQISQSSSAAEVSPRFADQGHPTFGHVRIALISQRVLLKLYSPRTATKSWESIQKRITKLLDELDEWASISLPGGSESVKGVHGAAIDRERFLLMAEYWSTKILITRPCLCRIERYIPNESSKSASFNSTNAGYCVDAALEMAKLFPDKPDLEFIYSRGPWWAIVHLIMQSTAILLLEMAYDHKDMKESASSSPGTDMFVSIKKLIRWLRALQQRNPLASRAYAVVWKILKACAPSLQAQAIELLADDEEKPQLAEHQPQRSTYGYECPQQEPQKNSNTSPISISEDSGSEANPYAHMQNQASYLNPNLFYTVNQTPTPMPFSNAFFTSFDEGAPAVNFQECLGDTEYPEFVNVSEPNQLNMNIFPDLIGNDSAPYFNFPPQE